MIVDELIYRFRAVYFHSVHSRSQEFLRGWQERGMRELLAYAYTNVPLWRELFDSRGILPRDILHIEDLARLPVTDKATYVGQPVEKYVDNRRSLPNAWRTTSGSSGTPFSFLHGGPAFRMADDMTRMRFIDRNAYLPNVKRLQEMRIVRIRVSPERRKNMLCVPMQAYREQRDETIDQILAFKPALIESYATVLFDLAKRLRERNIPAPPISYVISYGEMLTPAMRALMGSSFGAEVFDRYGLEETGIISMECREHDGQHIFGDLRIVEVLGPDGQQLPPGETGKIVVTDLFNYRMPFIRYDTGDQGSLTTATCRCGMEMPRLFVDGRTSVSLVFGKRRVHLLEFDGMMSKLMNAVLRYQIAKTGADSLEARIIPSRTGFDASVEQRIVAGLKEIAGDGVRVTVVPVQDIEATERGKLRTIVDESI